MSQDPFMDSAYDYPATDRSWYFNEQNLIRKLFVELEHYLHQHCVKTTQSFPPNPAEELPEVPTEYHTFVTIQSETQPPAKPLVTWYCATCVMIFKYAKTFNRQWDQAYTEIMADSNGSRESDRRITHPLRPPFPPPDVENIVEALQDETSQEKSPDNFNHIGFLQLGPDGTYNSYPDHI